MTKLNELTKEGLKEDEGMDIMIALAGLCIEKQYPELVANQDDLEDALDMPTVYKIIEVCGGVKLNDPNLQAAAIQKAMAEGGTN